MNFARPVVAFALLHQCSDKFNGDLLSGVALLVKPLVADLAGQVYDSGLLAARMAQAYGIPITATALEGFVARLVAAGILIEDDWKGGPKRAVYAEQDGVSVLAEEESEFQHLIDDFIGHAREILVSSPLSFTDDELVSEFLRHLSTLSFSAVNARPVVERGDKEPGGKIKGPEAKARIDLSNRLEHGATIDILVASYVQKLHAYDSQKLELLSKVADGALGIELVLDLQAPQSVPRFTDTVVIIDTPILLQFLDLSAAGENKVAIQLISQMTQAGASIAVFQHSVEEAEGILSAIKSALQAGSAYGRTVARMANSTYRAYFDSMIRRIAVVWKDKHHFELIQNASGHYYKNFSQADEDELTHQLMLSMEDKVLAREKDAHSVAETVRRLAGADIAAEKITIARYIFVTNNLSVQRRAAKFLRDKNYVKPGGLVPIVTDRYMAGLCWLITGGKSENSPTTARLLANCAAALRLRPELAAKTKLFLSKLDVEKAEHFEALMTNDRASQYLMEATFGNPELITEQNVEDIYDEMQHRAIERITQEKEALLGAKLEELQRDFDVKQSALLEAAELLVKNNNLEKEDGIRQAELARTALQLKVVEQDQSMQIQSDQLVSMSSQLTALQGFLAEQEVKNKESRARVRAAANLAAERRVVAIRVVGALIAGAMIFIIGYVDKFLIPSLPSSVQSYANWAVIGVQFAVGLLGAGVFSEKLTQRPFRTVKAKVVYSRLAAAGIAAQEDEASVDSK